MKFIPLILASIMSTLSAATVYDHELLDIDGEKKPLRPQRKGIAPCQCGIQVRIYQAIQGARRASSILQGQGPGGLWISL